MSHLSWKHLEDERILINLNRITKIEIVSESGFSGAYIDYYSNFDKEIASELFETRELALKEFKRLETYLCR